VLAGFTRGSGAWAAAPLPMNPDAAALAADPAKRAALVAWARDPATLAAVDRGVATVPVELAATTARAVTPGGFARRANRAFTGLVLASDVADLDFAGRAVVRSPAAYLRRLDEMTCGGCHQQRALAGFHWLGVDPPDVTPGDGLFVHESPHLVRELPRRAAIALAFARGEAPVLARPLTDHPPAKGGVGDHCALDDDPSYAGWTCGDGLACERGEAPAPDPTVGVCMTPARAVAVGDACDIGPIVHGRNARRDHIPVVAKRSCKGGVCDPRRLGLPFGVCVARCTRDGAPRGPGQTCGRIGATSFNLCLLEEPFSTCLRDFTRPVSLAACDRERACRDDYLCGAPAGPGAQAGACTPPYFLFQLRVDGHPAGDVAAEPK
jgi:hypothetical protein